MPAHRMSGNGLRLFGQRKGIEDQLWQLVRYIVPHAKLPGPGRLRGVDVKPRPLPQIIGIIIGHTCAARAGIGENQGNPDFGRPALRARFDHRIFMGAGQARQIPKHRHWRSFGLNRQEQAKGHLTPGDG